MARATKAAADRLRELHHQSQPVVFLNVWDGVSARIVESLGFPAVATSSAAISYAEGVADGSLSRATMLERVALIADCLHVPLSADLQSGYGQTVADAVATARGAIEAGAVGINFEDMTHDPQTPLTDLPLQLERIRAIRATADGLGIPLFINARTDAMHLAPGSEDERVGFAIVRARAFFEAGADCFFIPLVKSERLVTRVVNEVPGPVNVLAQDTRLPIARLGELGVRRISTGISPQAHALNAFRRAGRELLDGTSEFSRDRITYEELNELFDPATRR